MSRRKTCGFDWPGEYPPFFKRTGTPDDHADDKHVCTRPPGHPDHHACKCGARP